MGAVEQHVSGALVLEVADAGAVSTSDAMPVEQIGGLPVAARLVSRAWLVKSAEATLNPSIPQELSLVRLASSRGAAGAPSLCWRHGQSSGTAHRR